MTAMPPTPTVPPYPVAPQRQKGWWARNWVWMLVVGCVLVALLFVAAIGGAVCLGLKMMKSSDAYQLAIQQVRAAPPVIEKLGAPIEEGWYAAGNINVSGSCGSASLQFPIHGPKGSATVYVEATRSGGKWSLDELMVEIDQSGEQIQLEIRQRNTDLSRSRASPAL